MSALYQLSGSERSEAVADAYVAAVKASPDRRARVTYKAPGGTVTAIVFLTGLGWNVTYTGTAEALVVRKPMAMHILDLIPYTKLISIEPA